MKRPILLVMALFLSLCIPWSGLYAQTLKAAPARPDAGQTPASSREIAAQPKPERRADGTYTIRLPLSSLSPVKNVPLKGASAAFTFSLPVPSAGRSRARPSASPTSTRRP